MLSLEASKHMGFVETSSIPEVISPSKKLQDLSDVAYNLRESMQMTREDLAKAIGVSESELFDLELGRMQELSRGEIILQKIQNFQRETNGLKM